MTDILIRDAIPEDAAALLEIYRPYVERTAVSFEYAAPSLGEFAGRIASATERYPWLVAECGGRLLGYAYAGAYKSRPAYGWAAESTVYVDMGARRCGIGGRLYRELESVLRAQGVQNMEASIAFPPTPDEYLTADSAEFHARMGFVQVARFRACGYKFGRWYDSVWMEKLIGGHESPPPPFRPYPELRGARL